MKISFDLHGVIDDLPEVFQFITSAIIQAGGEVHILTGSMTDIALKELNKLGYIKGTHFTHVQGIPDLLLEFGATVTGYHPEIGNPEFQKSSWEIAKAIYCSDNKINLHFDDTIAYEKYFITPFARVLTKNK